jgi:signal transduction histidine kinase
MKHTLILIFLSFPCFSQLDSLNKVLHHKNLSFRQQIETFLAISQYYSDSYKNDSSRLFAEKALQLATEKKLPNLEVKAILLAAEASGSLTDFKSETEYAFRALYIAEKIQDTLSLAKAQKEIAFSFLRSDEASKSRLWLKKASKNFELLGMKKYVAFCEMTIGNTYHLDNQDALGFPNFEKAIKIANELNDEYVINLVKSNYAVNLFHGGKIKEAIANAESALPFFESSGDPTEYGTEYLNLGEYYHGAGNTEKAIFFTQKALDSLMTVKMWGAIKSASENLSEMFASKGNYKKAYDNVMIMNMAKDSLNYLELKDKTETLGLKYEAENRNLEIDNLNTTLENKQLTQYWLGSGLLFLTILGLSFFFTNKSLNRKNAQIESQKRNISDLNLGLEQKVKERTTELETALNEVKEAMGKGQSTERKRIASDLHDNLGSVLSAIGMNLEALDPKSLNAKEQKLYQNIKNMTADAYQEVRLISHNLSPKELESEGLKKALERLIIKFNQAQKTHFILEMKDISLSPSVELNLYSICMEACNNILKHANASNAKIYLRLNEKKVTLQISDNGIGISEVRIMGKGLQSMKERVESLNGTFDISKNVPSGSQITIFLDKLNV